MVSVSKEGFSPEQKEKENEVKIIFRPMSEDESVEYVGSLYANRDFYLENKLEPGLPDHEGLQELMEAGDFDEATKIFRQEIYPNIDVSEGVAKAEEELITLQSIVKRLKNIGNTLSHYEIRVTPFGPGGSYDAKTGEIILKFVSGKMRKVSIKNTLIHEIVHIALEDLVKENDLAHKEKERLVDVVVTRFFQDIIDEYPMQEIGSMPIDGFLIGNDFDDLNESIREFKKG